MCIDVSSLLRSSRAHVTQVVLYKVLSSAAQGSHRNIAVAMAAAIGLATIPLQKSQGFTSPAAKEAPSRDIQGYPQNPTKLAATTAAIAAAARFRSR